MLEYMPVREAAKKWGVSERRVHRLCKDGRIAGIIRFGRSWGIPLEAEKPEDARRLGTADAGRDFTEDDGTIEDFLGADAKLIYRGGNSAVFRLENQTGSGLVTVYDVFPGIRLFYNDLHLSRIAGHESRPIARDTDILVINHCREGRFECEFSWGECGYIGDGDMAVSGLPAPFKSSSYPLAHYHGISITADILKTAKTIDGISSLLGTSGVDIGEIKNRLLSKRPYFLVRSSDAVSHIFSELYQAPDALKESYIRLKLIELLLFLSVAKPDEENEKRYFYRTRINTAKAMRDYMTSHLERQFTLEELSKRFNIPLTAMKNCFKSVFGTPIHAYMREYRIQTASAMLRETDEQVSEIAAKVGYDSHAQFSSAFKAATGSAPSDYRKVFVQNQKSPSE